MMAERHIHPTGDDLVLHFYGENLDPAAIAMHLAECRTCATEYEAIAETLTLVPTMAPPDRGELYGLEVWQRIRPRLPAPAPFWRLPWISRQALAVAACSAVLAIAAFIAGRRWSPGDVAVPSGARVMTAVRMDADQRARAAAIADHLERSERVILDLSNAEGLSIDVSDQQVWAADLIDANRLYREAATQGGDTTIATVLDDLERSLLDIVHAPSKMTTAELDDVRARLDAAALLFKVRILSTELREREIAPAIPRKTT